MQKYRNDEKEIKKQLTVLKGKFTGSPFIVMENNSHLVKPEFMYFVADYYMNIMADAQKHVDGSPLKNDPNEVAK